MFWMSYVFIYVITPLAITPTQPPGTVDEAETLEVSDVTIMVSQAIDRISLNLANQAELGGPPIIVVSSEITIAAAVIETTPGVSNFMLSGLPNTMVSIPIGSFGPSGKIAFPHAISSKIYICIYI